MEWTKYTTKEALKDNDELMILDKDANANKRTLMDKIWDYVVDKMTTAVIAKLGTTNKTLIGAVNELNSKAESSLIRGFYVGSDSQKFILQPFSTYILTFATVSDSNISSDCDLALIVTSNSPTKTSRITWVTQSVAYLHSIFFFDTDNVLSFNIDPKSDNIWIVVSLTRL